MVPYSRNRNFAGREDIIDRIQKLAEDKARHSRIALCGLGGSGYARSFIRLGERLWGYLINKVLAKRKSPWNMFIGNGANAIYFGCTGVGF